MASGSSEDAGYSDEGLEATDNRHGTDCQLPSYTRYNRLDDTRAVEELLTTPPSFTPVLLHTVWVRLDVRLHRCMFVWQ